MMHTLTSKASRANDFCEGFGNELTILEDYQGRDQATTFYGSPGGQSQTVLFKPLLGLLSQNKFLPLSKMGAMTLELELVDEFNDPIVSPDTPAAGQVLDSDKFSITNTSNSWQIENVQVKVDLITLENSLENA